MKKVSDMSSEEIKKSVKEKYADIADRGIKYTSCCSTEQKSCRCEYEEDTPELFGYDIKGMTPSSIKSFAGCGNPTAIDNISEGDIVLDLGSGAGLDAFIASKKVGSSGKVIGVDMTTEMLDSARKSAIEMGITNVEFREGEIENLPVEDESVDIIISNCVINLSTDKNKVFDEAFRVLKSGGRIMVSDIVLVGNIPDDIKENIDAYTGCISGAIPENEYLSCMESSGFKRIRITSRSDSEFWSSISVIGHKE